MAVWQVPTPPPVPDVVTIGGPGGGPPEAFFIAAVFVTGFIVLGIVLYPLFRAWAKRLEGRGTTGSDPQLLERVGELEHRLAEAEERIDFNERMLARREPLALPRDKAD